MKIVAAQLNFTVGDFEGNTSKVISVIEKEGEIADLIIFPELAITGYYPMDLIEHIGFIDTQNKYLREIILKTKSYSAKIIIGAICDNKSTEGKKYHNSLLVISNGEIIYQYNKRLLPTYNIFDEQRHFSPGECAGIFKLDDIKLGVMICEDAWIDRISNYSVDPVSELSMESPDLTVIINASPSSIGKQKERENLFKNNVKILKCPIVYVNLVGGNDELVFDGNSFGMNTNGDLAYQLPSHKESTGIFEFINNQLSPLLDEPSSMPDNINLSPEDNQDLFFYNQISCGLADYVKKSGFKGVVVGCSGGIDSALTLALASLTLGSRNVVAITMPGPFSSSGSVNDSIELCQNLKIPLHHISIVDAYKVAVERFIKSFGSSPSKLTKENIQARIRGQIIMEYSNNFGNLPISTGNKSEMSVGYATLYGDMNGGLNIIGDLYKTEVYSLSNFINKYFNKELIPQAIIDKEPSAELSEGQKDSDSLPPYDILDSILRLYIESDLIDDNKRNECKAIIQDSGFDEVDKVLRMVDRAEYKRRQAPPIIRVNKKSFGVGRRIPIVNKYFVENV